MGKGRDARRKFRRGRNVDYAERQNEELKEKFSEVMESTAGLTAENIRLSTENARLNQLVVDANLVLMEHEKSAGSLIVRIGKERDEAIERAKTLTLDISGLNTLRTVLEGQLETITANWRGVRRELDLRNAQIIDLRRTIREQEAELHLGGYRDKKPDATPFTASEWKRIVALAHPDKHPDKVREEATEVTKILIRLRPK